MWEPRNWEHKKNCKFVNKKKKLFKSDLFPIKPVIYIIQTLTGETEQK